ncbi:MAG: hypothetical protein ACUVXI_17525 [bacterium]
MRRHTVFQFKPCLKGLKAYLAGDFNNWGGYNFDPEGMYEMELDEKDLYYKVSVPLGRGIYRYLYVLEHPDGSLEWFVDPENPDIDEMTFYNETALVSKIKLPLASTPKGRKVEGRIIKDDGRRSPKGWKMEAYRKSSSDLKMMANRAILDEGGYFSLKLAEVPISEGGYWIWCESPSGMEDEGCEEFHDVWMEIEGLKGDLSIQPVDVHYTYEMREPPDGKAFSLEFDLPLSFICAPYLHAEGVFYEVELFRLLNGSDWRWTSEGILSKEKDRSISFIFDNVKGSFSKGKITKGRYWVRHRLSVEGSPWRMGSKFRKISFL